MIVKRAKDCLVSIPKMNPNVKQDVWMKKIATIIHITIQNIVKSNKNVSCILLVRLEIVKKTAFMVLWIAVK